LGEDYRYFFWEKTIDIFFKEGGYSLFEEVQNNMAAFKKFVSSFHTITRLLPSFALIVEHRVAHSKNNCFMTIEV